jgi:hypothetical protein
MTPCVIRSVAGDVRLLGFPILEGFDDLPCHGAAAARNAREFITSTSFEDHAGLKMVRVLSVFGDVWSDDDGLVRKNIKLSKTDPQEIFPPEFDEDLARREQWEAEHPDRLDEEERDEAEEDADFDGGEIEGSEDDEDGEDALTTDLPKMTEKRVGVGEQVCAVGVYNEMRRGLLPPGRGRTPNRLIRGLADQIEQKSRSAFYRNLVGGLLALVIIHAAMYGVMQAYLGVAPP